METADQFRSNPKWMQRTGITFQVLVILFMAFDIFIHLFPVQATVDSLARLAIDPALAPTLGSIALVCVLLYAIPRTALLGAVLMTGYLGGAVLINLVVGSPLFSATLFPIYFGAIMWAGLYLRDQRLRDYFPFPFTK